MSQRAELERCRAVLDRIEAWIDGDLDGRDVEWITAHVGECSSCRTAKREAEEMVSALRSLPDFEIPEQLIQRVRDRARPGPASRFVEVLRRPMLSPLPALATAAAVALVVAVLSPWRGPNPPQFPDHEVVRAAEETRLAVALVGSVVRRGELSVTDRILKDSSAVHTVRGVHRSLQIIGGAAAAAADLPATPLPD